MVECDVKVMKRSRDYIIFLKQDINWSFCVTDHLFHFYFSCMFLNCILRERGGETLLCLFRFD